MVIWKFGALIDLDQLQLTHGCHQEETIDILTHTKRGQRHFACKLSCGCEAWPSRCYACQVSA